MSLFECIGYGGVLLYVAGYALLSSKQIDGNGTRYLVINLIAASMLIVSLLENFNGPSFATQGIWVVLSIYGIIKNQLLKKRATLIVEKV